MTYIQNLILDAETLKSLEPLKKRLTRLMELSTQQGLLKEYRAFAADVSHIDAKIRHLQDLDLEIQHHVDESPIKPLEDSWRTSE